ncbi:MAG: DUF87 domain-containing protein [Candidatus Aenigmatarchaeota archaeon]
MLNKSGNLIWYYDLGSPVRAVYIENITKDDGKEVVCGGDDLKISVLNSSGNLKWSYTLGNVINTIAVGEVDSENEGNEIVLGAGNSIYILNSSGGLIYTKPIGNTIKSVSIGDVTSSEGNEIVFGTQNGTVYVMTSLGDIEWEYSIGSTIYSVAIGDTTSDPGNEIAVGSSDGKIYQLSSSGSFIWSYSTGDEVQGVSIGDVSPDELNETIGVSISKNLYVLNFNYYPTNVSIDIGGDGDYEWSYSQEKLRSYANATNLSIGAGIQEYLNSCESKSCDLPILFHSDAGGDLEIASINITYFYNASGEISFQSMSNTWSRLKNIRVNSSLGYQIINITYTENTANNITIRYIKVEDESNNLCDFNDSSYQITTLNGFKVCNISESSYNLSSVGSLPPPQRFWYDSMSISTPAYINTTGGHVNGTGVWIKNMTIYTVDETTFINITANATLDESYVTSDEMLLVDWYENGIYHDITPSTGSDDCDTENPTYTKLTIDSDNFYVCKKDTNGNGIFDFFKWVQPHSSSREYKIQGSSNYPPDLKNIQVNSTSSIWGSAFNFSVDVGDFEKDNVTISLLIYFQRNDSWVRIGTKNVSTNGSVWFESPSDYTWVGRNIYKFEYRDFNNTTGEPLHIWQNTSSREFNVTKHQVEIEYISGHNSNVNRTGSNYTSFVIRVNDISIESYVGGGVNCSFWVTKDGITFYLVNKTTTNSTGHCNITFDPDPTFKAGQQKWIGGVDEDELYQSTNSSEFNVKVHVPISISFHPSIKGSNITRLTTTYVMGGMYDENNELVQVSGYDCIFYINDTEVPGNPYQTNSSGYCYYPWITSCSNSTGVYSINVSLSGTLYDYYYIVDSNDNTSVILKDRLNITITYPANNTIFYKDGILSLNSTVKDLCGYPSQDEYNIGWYMEKYGTCPSSNPFVTGGNTTWNIESNCDPGLKIVTANASGEMYFQGKDYLRILVYGWAIVNVTSPIAGNITNRGGPTYTNLVCMVRDNSTTSGISNYPVSFFDGSNFLGTNRTNSTGYATFRWNITSVTDGNHTIRCNITNNSTLYYNVSVNESESWMIIREEDLEPPSFSGVHATSVEPGMNVTIEANVTDWFGVSHVWVNITYPNSTNITYYLLNTSTNTLSGSWNATIVNVSSGMYDYVIYANDTSGLVNNTTGWFDVYPKIFFWGSTKNNDLDKKNLTVKFTFYRVGTSKTLEVLNHSSSPEIYNFSVFKTNADILVQVLNHQILFRNVNITSSLLNQFGENATNITNPLLFDNVSVNDVTLQPTTKNPLIALAIDSNLVFDNSTITLNFTNEVNKYPDLSKPALRIYRCSNWEFENRTGCYGSWEQLTSYVNITSNTISANISSLSAFVVAEDCPTCGGSQGGTGGGGAGGGGGGGGSSSRCGNGICELGENVYNCPKDCGNPEPPFSADTNLTEAEIEIGSSSIYGLWIRNKHSTNISVSIYTSGQAFYLVSLEQKQVELGLNEERLIPIYVYVPSSTDPGSYLGEIVLTGAGYTKRIPIKIIVPSPGGLYLDVVVESLTKRVTPNSTAVFHILVYNLGIRKANITINYLIKETETGNVIFNESEEKTIEASLPILKSVYIRPETKPGDYSFQVEIQFRGQKISSADSLKVVKPFLTRDKMKILVIFSILAFLIILGYYSRKIYKRWKSSKLRYIFPVDPKSLPKGELWIGEIAETNEKATLEMNEIRTHILTAGATGSGKSVSAMIIVEELLEKKIPVVVFDPTAQWTGFVRPCKDDDLLKFYGKFGMKISDAKSYKGMIYEVTDPNAKIDFKKYMNPGEITIFTLNKLKPGEYDQAVETIVNTIFEQRWEESTKLQMVIVLDEVHRLLEKYGGRGGYVALERACREFRKWGIGLIMISQVLSDFKEAIKGNVLTEIQLHTKSLEDLQRIEQKFGEEYAKKVTKLEVGVGMIQNPKYNKGKPYFVSFRPTYHSPHKIPEQDLEMYKEYERMIKEIEERIEKLSKEGKNVFDLTVELKLAKDKLKKGMFRMAKIYIDSLTKSLNSGGSDSKK